MELLIGLAVLVVLSIPLAISLSRSTELFVAQIRDGELKLVRGRAPQSLLDELADVVGRPRVKRAVLRVIRQGGRPRVLVSPELSEAQEQRLRNVVGRFEVQTIRSGTARRGGPGRRR